MLDACIAGLQSFPAKRMTQQISVMSLVRKKLAVTKMSILSSVVYRRKTEKFQDDYNQGNR